MQFTFKRFIKLIRLQLALNRKFHTYTALALAGIMISYMLYVTFGKPYGLDWSYQEQLGYAGMGISCMMLAAYYWRIGSKDSRLQALVLPVSVMERLAVALFFNLIIYPLAYMVIYLVCGGICHYIDSYLLLHGNRFFYYEERGLVSFLSNIIMLVSIGLAAGITFRTYPVAKAVVICALIFISINSLGSLVATQLLENEPPRMFKTPSGVEIRVHDKMSHYSSFERWSIRAVTDTGDYADYTTVERPAWMNVAADTLFMLIPFGLVFVSYFKLREATI